MRSGAEPGMIGAPLAFPLPMAIEDLYRDVILDHYRNPRRRGRLDHGAVHAEGTNPSCGDSFAVDVLMGDGVVTDIATQGQGCSISQASGSMMADAVVGLSVDEVRSLAGRFKAMMSITDGEPHGDASLGDLEALSGVRKFPVRIRCADLAWTTLDDALTQWETAPVG